MFWVFSSVTNLWLKLYMEDQNFHCKLPSYILVDGSFTVAKLPFLTWALGSTYHASSIYMHLYQPENYWSSSVTFLIRQSCPPVFHSGQGAQRTPDTQRDQSYQQVRKPFCPHPPVQTQVLGEKAGDVLPPSVRHEARCSQLSHVGINKRNPRFAFCRDKRWSWDMMTFLGTHKPTCGHAFTAI